MNQSLPGLAREMRRNIIEMAFASKTAHVGPALCIADILAVLYFRVMNVRSAEPEWDGRDRFILSKGHAASALYAALALKGFFPKEELSRYCVDGGRFHGHPCRDAAPGIEFSSGSLGHGLSVAAGVALGLREDANAARVFVLLGDGECNEGSVWEAAMFAATHALNRVTAVVDKNKFQGFGATDDVHHARLADMWSAFGWNALAVDGHDLDGLERAFQTAGESEKPTVILADTISGKGMRSIENTLRAHYAVPDEAAMRDALKELYAE